MSKILLALSFCLFHALLFAQTSNFKVIAYYGGNGENLEQYRVDQLDQVIFSFLNLKDDSLAFGRPEKADRLRSITALKAKYPKLSVLVSLGGWGGCYTCSDVFSTDNGRKQFASSVNRICRDFDADGIDLDWEYPGIEGHPGHPWKKEDVGNFTALVQALRDSLGSHKQISFAAGGFTKFIEESIDWEKVMPLVDRVNLMTYDLVSGFSKETGHHTPLYSNSQQKESTDHCVQMLLNRGVPAAKLIVGAAFYGRVWKDVPALNTGIYQPGVFERGVSYNQQDAFFDPEKGWQMHVDEVAKAPYAYNPDTKQFATFDDKQSVTLKTKYAREKKLGGIMFWQLGEDKQKNGLLQAIYDASK